MKKLLLLLLLSSMTLFAFPAGNYDWKNAEKLHDGILHA